MYMNHTLSRSFDEQPHTSFSITDDDAINAAHMIAAGFNTMNRNFMGAFVLGVIDTQAGTVQYDGKTEQIKRDEPWSISQTFKFEGSTAGDALLTFFGEDAATTYTLRGDLNVDEPEPSEYAHIAREVLEAAYAELQDVKDVLSDAGTETIPATAGVQELTRRLEHERHARSNMERQHGEANEAARAEMISFVKRAHAKKQRIQAAGEPRPELDDRWRGMLDVLAKFLVVTGEADKDESHAVARRLCEVNDDEF
jgi:hypothetical protein